MQHLGKRERDRSRKGSQHPEAWRWPCPAVTPLHPACPPPTGQASRSHAGHSIDTNTAPSSARPAALAPTCRSTSFLTVFPSAHRNRLRASPADRAPRGRGAWPSPGGFSHGRWRQPLAPGLLRAPRAAATHGSARVRDVAGRPPCLGWAGAGAARGKGLAPRVAGSRSSRRGLPRRPALTHQQPHVEVVALGQQLRSMLADHGLHLRSRTGGTGLSGERDSGGRQPVPCPPRAVPTHRLLDLLGGDAHPHAAGPLEGRRVQGLQGMAPHILQRGWGWSRGEQRGPPLPAVPGGGGSRGRTVPVSCSSVRICLRAM